MFGPSPVRDEIAAIMADYPEESALIRVDPPAHRPVRSLVASVRTPSKVAAFEPTIRAIVDEMAEKWIGRGDVEFVGEFAAALPGAVTTDFLCGEPEMRESFAFWAGEIMSRVARPQPLERQLEVARNIAEMGRHFLDRIAERRKERRNDLISLIANAATREPVADVALVNVLETFMVGGNETTSFLLGQAMLRLAGDPALAEQLRQDPGRIPDFVEEMLRLESPAQSMMRRTTRTVEIGSATIPAGANVLVALVSANRDETAFAGAHELDLDRPSNPRHVAFGDGNHVCLGPMLARAETRIALEAILPRMRDIRVEEAEVRWLENDFLRGPMRIPLRFTPV